MKKFTICGISLCTLLAAGAANAAGYTCEELIEYTSCSDGYYLNAGDCIAGNTCGAGNYLVHICPGDDEEFPEYLYSDNWCYDGDMMTSSGWDGEDMTQNLCEEEYGGEYFGPGCVHWEYADVASSGKATGENFVPANVECVACDAGTYQPSAGQYSCITCPAGSECPTTTAATLCEAGEWSAAGATACSTCPTHSYTNASGQSVTVSATSLAGAAGMNECYIDPDTYFTDVTGTYHFKENCVYGGTAIGEFDASTATESELRERCKDLGGYWQELIHEQVLLGGAKSYDGFFCSGGIDRYDVTEEECGDLYDTYGDWYWIEEEGEEMCECGLSTIAIDLMTGEKVCADIESVEEDY